MSMIRAIVLVCLCLSSNVNSYVDNQLRTSTRFDAEGIERDYPELFVPSPRRRSSSSHSLASLASFNMTDSSGSTKIAKEEGQLRYWTNDMCRRSPHLFDFVLTVRAVSDITPLTAIF